MKKYISFFMAALALALTGCSRQSIQEEDLQEITLEAVMAENHPTKTVIQEGTTAVLWEANDEIKVFFNGVGSRFTNQNTEPAGTAMFSGVLNVVFGSNEGFSDDTPLWGLYPYRADATSDNASVTTTLPAQQTGRAGSFAKGTFITLGRSATRSMSFYNVCGGVRFSLTQEGIKEVVFQSQNEESLTGKVKIAFADGVPAVQEVTEGESVITLTAPNNGTFETGKWYYIVAIPGTLSGGFKMTFNTETEYATRKSNKSVTIKRSIFGSLAEVDADLIFIEKGSSEPDPNDVIQFKDPIAKYACVEKFDSNSDGEVSYEEAAAATSLSWLFTDWDTVTEFDEIQFFTSVTSTQNVFIGLSHLKHITIPDNITTLGSFQNCAALDTVALPAALNSIPTYCFDGCSSLKSVTLPTGITSIPNYAFRGCAALESINLPPNVITIGQYAFSGCSSLGSIEIPSGVTSIANYCFQNCTSLASVGIPSGVTSIGQYAFRGCSSLGAVDLPANLTSIGQYSFSGCSALSQMIVPNSVTSLGNFVFSGCSKLETITLPSGITSIPQDCFQNCVSLTSVTVPEGITSVGGNAFTGVKMWKLELPTSITSLGSSCFGSIFCVLLPSTSPVTNIQSNSFAGVKAIFVPGNLIDMYTAMTNWSNYASKLHPINTYKENNEFVVATSGAVDMGTSVKWAAYNVGATRPEEYGNYYAWGETETKTNYNRSTYEWCNGDYNKLTKYCPTDKTDYWDGAGSPDYKTVLDLDDDAARANWGGTWRMPTDEEWTELKTRCLWEWTTYEGIYGRKVYCFETGNAIFLPAAGSRYDSNLGSAGSYGYYWSSSLRTDYPYCAWHVYFDSGGVYRGNGYRYYGFSVRPVSE